MRCCLMMSNDIVKIDNRQNIDPSLNKGCRVKISTRTCLKHWRYLPFVSNRKTIGLYLSREVNLQFSDGERHRKPRSGSIPENIYAGYQRFEMNGKINNT